MSLSLRLFDFLHVIIIPASHLLGRLTDLNAVFIIPSFSLPSPHPLLARGSHEKELATGTLFSGSVSAPSDLALPSLWRPFLPHRWCCFLRFTLCLVARLRPSSSSPLISSSCLILVLSFLPSFAPLFDCSSGGGAVKGYGAGKGRPLCLWMEANGSGSGG